MSTGHWFAIAVWLPAWIALLFAAPAAHSMLNRLMPWAALPVLIFSAVTVASANEFTSTAWVSEWPWLLLGVQLGLDRLTSVFLLFTALLWFAAGHFAHAYLEHDKRRAQFNGFFLLAMAGNFSLIAALDVASFYFSFALMTFAAYVLVVHDATNEARRAGRVYIVLAVIGEALLLAGLLLGSSAPGNVDIATFRVSVATAPERELIVALLFAGFGVKAGVPLLHMWLPLAHPVAPTPASAVLSGAMIKAGLLGWLQFLPVSIIAMPAWSTALVLIGIAAAFYGVIVGLMQDAPKTILAYSSISQMGFMTVAVGVALSSSSLAPLAVMVSASYAIHHGLSKGALFLSVGLATGGRMPKWLLWSGIAASALSLSGAPLLSGALAKSELKALLFQAESSGTIIVALSLAATGTTLLMIRFAFALRAKLNEKPQRQLAPAASVAWLGLVLASLVLPWTVLLNASATSVLTLSKLWAAAWPVMLGCVVASLAIRTGGTMRTWRMPAGDVLQPIAYALSQATRALSAGSRLTGRASRAWLNSLRHRLHMLQGFMARLSRAGERHLLSNASASALIAITLLLLLSSIR